MCLFWFAVLQMWQTAAAPDDTYTVDFTDIELTDPDDCIGHQCVNGGTCADGDFSYSCDCPDNYSGDFCTGKRMYGTQQGQIQDFPKVKLKKKKLDRGAMRLEFFRVDARLISFKC